jgi:hypothetical protein
MAILEAVVLTCCLATGTPDVPTGVAENLQLNNIYIEFPQGLKPYLTEEQEDFLETTYTTVDDEIQIQVTEILTECEEKKIQEEERIKAEEEAKRIAEEQAKYEARCAEVGNQILDAISRTGSPGSGWCAKWISMVYQNAGYRYISGNACDMYWNYCTSADRGQLKNGMLIAVPSWNGSYMSRAYGHVGIYIDGYVWHNVGSINKTPVDEWISQYGDLYQVQWGYPIEV